MFLHCDCVHFVKLRPPLFGCTRSLFKLSWQLLRGITVEKVLYQRVASHNLSTSSTQGSSFNADGIAHHTMYEKKGKRNKTTNCFHMYLTGPCSKDDSCYIRKLEISKIKKPSCFVRLIPRYIQVLSAESWKNVTFFPFPQFSHICWEAELNI